MTNLTKTKPNGHKTPTKSVFFLQNLRKKFPRCSIGGIDFNSLDTAATCCR